MKNQSDEEQLLRLILIQAKIMPYWNCDDDENVKILLSRLERGRKAMENFKGLLSDLQGMNYIVRNLVYCPRDRAYMISELKIHADKDASNLIKRYQQEEEVGGEK